MAYDTNTQPFVNAPYLWNAAEGGGIHEYVYESRLQNMAIGGLGKIFSGSNLIELGSVYRTFDGRVFRLVENVDSSAFAEGTILSPYEVNSTSLTLVTSSDGKSVSGLSGLTVGAWRGGYIYQSAGTGEGQTRRIVHNTADTVYVERAFTTAPSGGSCAVRLWHPYRCIVAAGSAATQRPCGVSIGTVTAVASSGRFVAGGTSYIGWMQTKGLCEKVLVASAINANAQMLIMSGTAGQAEAVGSSATLDDQYIFGTLPGTQGGSTWDTAVPAIIWFE